AMSSWPYGAHHPPVRRRRRSRPVRVHRASADPRRPAAGRDERLGALAGRRGAVRPRPGGSHPEQPEHRRQLVVGISGRAEVTATGETRAFGPGDILLVEDTDGFGHSSRTPDGFVAAFVVLDP